MNRHEISKCIIPVFQYYVNNHPIPYLNKNVSAVLHKSHYWSWSEWWGPNPGPFTVTLMFILHWEYLHKAKFCMGTTAACFVLPATLLSAQTSPPPHDQNLLSTQNNELCLVQYMNTA